MHAAGDRLAVGAYSDDGKGVLSSTDNYGAVHLFTNNSKLLGSFSAVSDGAYATLPDSNITLRPSDLTAQLSAGTAVTLQASNDLTLTRDLLVDHPGGSGGALTLQAGRSLLLNGSITTDHGNLTLIANDTLANGVQDTHRDAGAAEITMASGTALNAGNHDVALL